MVRGIDFKTGKRETSVPVGTDKLEAKKSAYLACASARDAPDGVSNGNIIDPKFSSGTELLSLVCTGVNTEAKKGWPGFSWKTVEHATSTILTRAV